MKLPKISIYTMRIRSGFSFGFHVHFLERGVVEIVVSPLILILTLRVSVQPNGDRNE